MRLLDRTCAIGGSARRRGCSLILFFKRTPAARHYVYAGVLAVVIPMALGIILFRMNPAACYDSPCALPLLLLTIPPYAAPLLSVLFAVNHRRQRPFPDGWLPTILISGIVGQMGISVFGFVLASPNMRRIFLPEILFIPQGLIVGLAIAGAFWIALHVLGREAPPK